MVHHSHLVTSLLLLNVRHVKDERLKAFIDRFSKIELKIKNLTKDVVLQYMVMALKPDPFVDNLCLRPPTTMHELRLRAANYIRVEEMKELRRKFCKEFQQGERKGADKMSLKAEP